MHKNFSTAAVNHLIRHRQFGGMALTAIGVLAAAAAVTSAVIWGMHLTASSAGVPEFSKAVAVKTTPQSKDNVAAVTQMFGSSAAMPLSSSREIEGLKLLGIVADQRGTGVALFSIDGAAPVRVRSGGVVRDGVKLVEIQPRQVVLERGGKTIEMAVPARVASPSSKP